MKRTKSELETKINELRQWLVDNPGHPNTVEVQSDLREAEEQLNNPDANE